MGQARLTSSQPRGPFGMDANATSAIGTDRVRVVCVEGLLSSQISCSEDSRCRGESAGTAPGGGEGHHHHTGFGSDAAKAETVGDGVALAAWSVAGQVRVSSNDCLICPKPLSTAQAAGRRGATARLPRQAAGEIVLAGGEVSVGRLVCILRCRAPQGHRGEPPIFWDSYVLTEGGRSLQNSASTAVMSEHASRFLASIPVFQRQRVYLGIEEVAQREEVGKSNSNMACCCLPVTRASSRGRRHIPTSTTAP